MKINDDMTLGQVKAYVLENRDKGLRCPCCDRIVKTYKYPMNVGLARAMIAAYRITKELQPADGWFHLQRQFTSHLGLNANSLCYSRLKWWGMLESSTQTPSEDKNATGSWRITEKGKQFVEGAILVPESIQVYDNNLVGISDGYIDIHTALTVAFNYSELMGRES